MTTTIEDKKIRSKEGKRERRRFAPPALSELKDYINKMKYNVNPENFIDFYTTKGWMVGKNKMQDWQAAVRTWARRDQDKPSYDEDETIKRILNS